MLPLLFRIRGIEVHSYPAFLFLGLTFGVIAGTHYGKEYGLEPVRLYAALLLLIIPALAGSRLLYVMTHWKYYRDHTSEIWSRASGGAALYGGLLLALACSVPLLPLFGLTFGAFWDAATITLLVGMIFTKIGCLLNGCCAGQPTEGWLGMHSPNTLGVWRRRVPSQLLECGLALVLFFVAMLWRDRPFDGALFLTSLAIYAAARLPLGATRETVDRIGRFDVYNSLTVALLIASIVAIAIIR